MYSKKEAAFLILKHSKNPLHVKGIIRIALAKDMIQTKGKTPELSLTADLHRELSRGVKGGGHSRFCYMGPGMWGLTEWGTASVKPHKPKNK